MDQKLKGILQNQTVLFKLLSYLLRETRDKNVVLVLRIGHKNQVLEGKILIVRVGVFPSVGNFARKLVGFVFQWEELEGRNRPGTRVKRLLDKGKLDLVR